MLPRSCRDSTRWPHSDCRSSERYLAVKRQGNFGLDAPILESDWRAASHPTRFPLTPTTLHALQFLRSIVSDLSASGGWVNSPATSGSEL